MRMINTAPTVMLATALMLSGVLSGCSGEDSSVSDDPPSVDAGSETAAVDAAPDVFVQCTVCHSMEPGKQGLGPSLAGISGAKAGAVKGYTYSKAMLDAGLTWDDETLGRYLEDPATTVPGTKMAFGGLKDPAERAEIIAYLKEN